MCGAVVDDVVARRRAGARRGRPSARSRRGRRRRGCAWGHPAVPPPGAAPAVRQAVVSPGHRASAHVGARPYAVRHDAQWHRPDRTRPRRPSPGRPLRPRERPVARGARDPRGPRDGRRVPRPARPGGGAGPRHHHRRRRSPPRRGRPTDPVEAKVGAVYARFMDTDTVAGRRRRAAARRPRARRGGDHAGRADRGARRAAAHRRRGGARRVLRRQRLQGAHALRRATSPRAAWACPTSPTTATSSTRRCSRPTARTSPACCASAVSRRTRRRPTSSPAASSALETKLAAGALGRRQGPRRRPHLQRR